MGKPKKIENDSDEEVDVGEPVLPIDEEDDVVHEDLTAIENYIRKPSRDWTHITSPTFGDTIKVYSKEARIGTS